MSILDLPSMPNTAAPVIVPGLLSALDIATGIPARPGITRRPVPAWITDPDAITSIALGLVVVDDEFMARDEPTLEQIRRRITGWLCFYVAVWQARVVELEQRIVATGHPVPAWSDK